jgi:hypothetical protein
MKHSKKEKRISTKFSKHRCLQMKNAGEMWSLWIQKFNWKSFSTNERLMGVVMEGVVRIEKERERKKQEKSDIQREKRDRRDAEEE